MQEQILFFKKLKEALSSQVLLAEEIADLLHISIDAAYRRMRGETAMTYDEFVLLNKHFNTGKAGIETENDVVAFKHNSLYKSSKAFDVYIDRLINDLKTIHTIPHSQIIYCALDIPIFYYFNFPHLAHFKVFFWRSSVLGIDPQISFSESKKNLSSVVAKLQQFYTHYLQTNSIEIWTTNTIDSFIRQLEFYYDTGIINDIEDVKTIISEAKQMLQFVEKQAAKGYKEPTHQNLIPFEFYVSDLLLGNNLILTNMGKEKWSFVSYQGFNSIRSSDKNFYADNEKWVSDLKTKSLLLSQNAEKYRVQFFKKQGDKLSALAQRIGITEK